MAALAAAIVLASAGGASGAATGNLRFLVVLATWGPTPMTVADVRRTAVEQTDAFFRASSGGRLALTGTVVGWVRLDLPGRGSFCQSDAMAEAFAAERPDIDLDAYDRVAWVVPFGICGFGGVAQQLHVVLHGSAGRTLTAHELGHTLGLGHANRWQCSGASCGMVEYGSPFSVMGGGHGDFHAYEKDALGWLGGIVRPERADTYEIAPIEGSSTRPQALAVKTGGAEYWFESRSQPVEPFGQHGPAQPPSVVVLGGVTVGATAPSPFTHTNLVLPNPRGGDRYGYLAGETFSVPGAFDVVVERNDASGALLRFAWTDRTPPPRPRVVGVERRRTRVTIDWEPAVDRGSGRVGYVIVVDGRDVRRTGALDVAATLTLRRGAHTVGVAALDRAGLRGRTATVRVVVR